jgi:formylglycine-generating enzyme required for sulfatase activity
MKAFRYFLISILLICFVIIATVPLWKPFLFVNENLLPDTITGLKKMHLIKGSGFNMGDDSGHNSTALPMRFVKVNSFYMDETPVTVGDFQKFISAGGALPNYWNNEQFQQKDIPITGVSWNMAVDYCNWRSRVEGLDLAYELTDDKDVWGNLLWELNERKNGYRLPTEAEFEFAARGGLTGSAYPWGEAFEKTFANYDNEKGKPLGNWVLLAEVQTQKSNAYGLKGMSGNVWQWCNDWFDYKYDVDANGKNPFGPIKGDTKVLRGGSWGSISPEQLKVSYRSMAAVGNYNYDVGFRCVRPVKRGIIKTLKKKEFDTSVAYEFYNELPANHKNNDIDYSSNEFKNRLVKYLKDNYSNSLYFHEDVGGQQKINPDQLAALIIKSSLRNGISPVFTTAVMVAESGIGAVSMSRWSNNPVAYNWEMPELNGSQVVFASNNFKVNTDYNDLQACFNDFFNYLNQPHFKETAVSDLFDYQKEVNGEEKMYIIKNITNVYRDLVGWRIEEDFPRNNVGEFIYTKWQHVQVDEEVELPAATEEEVNEQEEQKIEETFTVAEAKTAWDNKTEVATTEKQKVASQEKEQPIEFDNTTTTNLTAKNEERDAVAAPKRSVFYLVVKQGLELETASLLAKQLRERGFPEAGVIPHKGKSAIALKEFTSSPKASTAKKSLEEIFSDISIVQKAK